MKLLISLTDQSFRSTKSIGIFNVSIGLTQGLMKCKQVNELHILGNDECAAHFKNLPKHVTLHLREKSVPCRFGRLYWDQIGVQRAIRAIQPDWAILPKGFPPYFKALGRTKLACYLHDLNWEYYNKDKGGKDSPFPAYQLAYFSRLGLRSLEISDLVLTSTRFNRERFLSYHPQSKVAVVGIGFDGAPQDSPPKYGKDILLFISPYPHKRTREAIPKLKQWLAHRIETSEDARNIKIHLIGSLPEGIILPSSNWIEYPRLPYKELILMMRSKCRCSIYFSDYEGYGMPPVESLRAGIPCLASDLPPIRENIPARFLFENGNLKDFIQKLDAIYDHPNTADRPNYPNWHDVAKVIVSSMIEATKR